MTRRNAEEEDVDLRHVGFKADPPTLEAIERLWDAAVRGSGPGKFISKSDVIRAALQAQAALLPG